MTFVYHLVPSNMGGGILYPLNRLKKKYPQVYKKEIKKYKGREHFLKDRVPVLNCLWGDVIHLTSIHPSKINKALKEAGFKTAKLKWYKIKAEDLNHKKAVIFLYLPKKNHKDNLEIKDFRKYTPTNVLKYGEVPKE